MPEPDKRMERHFSLLIWSDLSTTTAQSCVLFLLAAFETNNFVCVIGQHG